MIQESINQMLGTMAVASKFSPSLKERRELRKTEEQEKTLDAQLEAANKGAIEYDMEKTGDEIDPELVSMQHSNIADVYDLQRENYKKRFELQSTPENYKKMISAQNDAARLRKKANEFAAMKIENAVEQDNAFKDLRQSIILDKSGQPSYTVSEAAINKFMKKGGNNDSEE